MDRRVLLSRRHHVLRNPAAVPARAGVNKEAVDAFTLAHIAFGALLGIIGVPWWVAAGFAVGWELLERPMKATTPQMFPVSSQDSFANAAFDAVGMFGGWAAARGVMVGHFRRF